MMQCLYIKPPGKTALAESCVLLHCAVMAVSLLSLALLFADSMAQGS